MAEPMFGTSSFAQFFCWATSQRPRRGRVDRVPCSIRYPLDPMLSNELVKTAGSLPSLEVFEPTTKFAWAIAHHVVSCRKSFFVILGMGLAANLPGVLRVTRLWGLSSGKLGRDGLQEAASSPIGTVNFWRLRGSFLAQLVARCRALLQTLSSWKIDARPGSKKYLHTFGQRSKDLDDCSIICSCRCITRTCFFVVLRVWHSSLLDLITFLLASKRVEIRAILVKLTVSQFEAVKIRNQAPLLSSM